MNWSHFCIIWKYYQTENFEKLVLIVFLLLFTCMNHNTHYSYYYYYNKVYVNELYGSSAINGLVDVYELYRNDLGLILV